MATLKANESRELSLVAMLGMVERGHNPPALPVSVSRRIALQVLFELDCTNHNSDTVVINRIDAQGASRDLARDVQRLVTNVLQNISYLDELIEAYAINWQLENLAIVDRNILRIGILELAIVKTTPVAAIVNEAIELARLFSGEDSFDFIHGILGNVADDIGRAEKRESRGKEQEEAVAKEREESRSEQKPQNVQRGRYDQGLFQLIQTIAYSGKDFLESERARRDLRGSSLPGQVVTVSYDRERQIVYAILELKSERHLALFPEATHIEIAVGEATALLEQVSNEFVHDAPMSLDDSRRDRWRVAISELEKQGNKVLAIAWQPQMESAEDESTAITEKYMDDMRIAPAGGELPVA